MIAMRMRMQMRTRLHTNFNLVGLSYVLHSWIQMIIDSRVKTLYSWFNLITCWILFVHIHSTLDFYWMGRKKRWIGSPFLSAGIRMRLSQAGWTAEQAGLCLGAAMTTTTTLAKTTTSNWTLPTSIMSGSKLRWWRWWSGRL